MSLILPKKIDLEKAKIQERKTLIDEGMALATRVDELRKMRVDMEVNFDAWRKKTSDAILKEHADLIQKRDILANEVISARKERDALREPLDAQWAILNKEKESIESKRNELFLEQERISLEKTRLNKERSKVSLSIRNAQFHEKETERSRNEAANLAEMARKDRRQASEECDRNIQESRKEREEAESLRRTYEVGIQTASIREKQADEREETLLIREKDLERRTKQLQKVQELQKNGNS